MHCGWRPACSAISSHQHREHLTAGFTHSTHKDTLRTTSFCNHLEKLHAHKTLYICPYGIRPAFEIGLLRAAQYVPVLALP